MLHWTKSILPYLAALGLNIAPAQAQQMRRHSIDYIVIHCTEGSSAVSATSTLRERGLSIHYLIERNGNLIKYYSEQLLAQHAGHSRIKNINERSIGIELVNWGEVKKKRNTFYAGHHFTRAYDLSQFGQPVLVQGKYWAPYSEKQMETLVKLTTDILSRHHQITLTKIVGHEEIAKKKDPGAAFNWGDYLSRVRSLLIR